MIVEDTPGGASSETLNATSRSRSEVDTRKAVVDLETLLLLDGVARLSGFDFREYSPTLVKRRIAERVRAEGTRTIAGLLERVIHEPAVLERFLAAIASGPTVPFRDPPSFASLATCVIPRLRTYPYARMWIAGNAADAFAAAILLHEGGLLDRVRIYATDATESGLAAAKLGSIDADGRVGASDRYRHAGGRKTFDDYLEPIPGGARYKTFLSANVLFARHHLASEGSFNEFEAVMVRTPPNAYGRALAYRVHQTLYESVARLGFLCVSSHEPMSANPHRGAYEALPGSDTVFRRVR